MVRMKKNLMILAAALSLILSACSGAGAGEPQEQALAVTVSILPQAYFVNRIGGGLVTTNVMVGPGEEAHTYEPTPEQMKSLNDSRIFFSIGVEYEETWIPRFQDVNPDLRIVDSAEGIERLSMASGHHHHDGEDHGHEDHKDHENHEEHAHETGEGEEHQDEERLDPHVWLSPANGKIIAENILQAMIDLAPEHAGTFQENYEALINDINALDADIQETLSGAAGGSFMVFHPAWGYFAHAYDLEQIPVQVGGQDPSPAELAELVEIAQEENIRVVFVQPTFSTADAEAIAEEINAEVAVVDPLAQDWLENLKTVTEAFANALEN